MRKWTMLVANKLWLFILKVSSREPPARKFMGWIPTYSCLKSQLIASALQHVYQLNPSRFTFWNLAFYWYIYIHIYIHITYIIKPEWTSMFHVFFIYFPPWTPHCWKATCDSDRHGLWRAPRTSPQFAASTAALSVCWSHRVRPRPGQAGPDVMYI